MDTAALPSPADLPRPGGLPRWRRPLPLIAISAWAVPGLGHALLGQWRAATLMMGAILALYGGGLALTDFTAVDPERHGLEFIAHVFAGGPTALTMWLTEGLEPTRLLPYLDVGRLYVAVASLLNLVAVTDAMEKAARLNHQHDTWRARRDALLRPAPLPSTPSAMPAVNPAAPAPTLDTPTPDASGFDDTPPFDEPHGSGDEGTA